MTGASAEPDVVRWVADAAGAAAWLPGGVFWPGARLGLTHRENAVSDRAGAVAVALREGIFR